MTSTAASRWSGIAAASADTLKEIPSSAYDRFRGTRASAPQETTALRLFSNNYETAYGESAFTHSFTAHAYDAAWLVIAASIEAQLRAKPINGAEIAQGLKQLSSPSWKELSNDECPFSLDQGNCPAITLSASEIPQLIEGLKTYGQVDVLGASGSLNYCSNEEELERSIDSFSVYCLEETTSSTEGDLNFMLVDKDVGEGIDDAARCPNE